MSSSTGALDPDAKVSSTSDLARLLGGSEDSFTGGLLRLIAKSDLDNRARLLTSFPREVQAYLIWMRSPMMTAAELVEILDRELATLDQMLGTVIGEGTRGQLHCGPTSYAVLVERFKRGEVVGVMIRAGGPWTFPAGAGTVLLTVDGADLASFTLPDSGGRMGDTVTYSAPLEWALV